MNGLLKVVDALGVTLIELEREIERLKQELEAAKEPVQPAASSSVEPL